MIVRLTMTANETLTGDKQMTTAELKNAKINAIVELDVKYRRFSNGLKTPGVDQAAIQKILDRIQNQKAELEREIAMLG